MKKRVIYPAEISNAKFMSHSEMATVVTLQDGSVLKVFNPSMLNFMKGVGIDTERKILDAVPIKDSPEILIPTAAAYFPNGRFMGYTINRANGIDHNAYDDRLDKEVIYICMQLIMIKLRLY